MYDLSDDPDELLTYSRLVNIVENVQLKNITKKERKKLSWKIIMSYIENAKYRQIPNINAVEHLLRKLFASNIFDEYLEMDLVIIDVILDSVRDCEKDNVLNLIMLFKMILSALAYAQENNTRIDWIEMMIERDPEVASVFINKTITMENTCAQSMLRTCLFDVLLVIDQCKPIRWNYVKAPFMSFILDNFTPVSSLQLPQVESTSVSWDEASQTSRTLTASTYVKTRESASDNVASRLINSLDSLDSELKILICILEALVKPDGGGEEGSASTSTKTQSSSLLLSTTAKPTLLIEISNAARFNRLCEYYLHLVEFHRAFIFAFVSGKNVTGRASSAIAGIQEPLIDPSVVDALLMDMTSVITLLAPVVDTHTVCKEITAFIPRLRQVCEQQFASQFERADSIYRVPADDHDLVLLNSFLRIQCTFARISPLMFFGSNEFTIADFGLLISYFSLGSSRLEEQSDDPREATNSANTESLFTTLEDIVIQLLNFTDKFDLVLLERLLVSTEQTPSTLLGLSMARLLLHLLITRQDVNSVRGMFGDCGKFVLTGLRKRTYLDDQPGIRAAVTNLVAILIPLCSNALTTRPVKVLPRNEADRRGDIETLLYLIMICCRCDIRHDQECTKSVLEYAAAELEQMTNKPEQRRVLQERVLLILRIISLTAITSSGANGEIAAFYSGTAALTTYAKFHKRIIRSVLWHLTDRSEQATPSVSKAEYQQDMILAYSQYLLLIVTEVSVVSSAKPTYWFLDSDQTDSIQNDLDFIVKYIKHKLSAEEGSRAYLHDLTGEVDYDPFFDLPTESTKAQSPMDEVLDDLDFHDHDIKDAMGASHYDHSGDELHDSISRHLLDACWQLDISRTEDDTTNVAKNKKTRSIEEADNERRSRGVLLLILSAISPEYALLYLVTAPFHSRHYRALDFHVQYTRPPGIEAGVDQLLKDLTGSTIPFTFELDAVEAAASLIIDSELTLTELSRDLFPIALATLTKKQTRMNHICINVGSAAMLLYGLLPDVFVTENDARHRIWKDPRIIIVPVSNADFDSFLAVWSNTGRNHHTETRAFYQICIYASATSQELLGADCDGIDIGLLDSLLTVSQSSTSHFLRLLTGNRNAASVTIQEWVQSTAYCICIHESLSKLIHCSRLQTSRSNLTDSEPAIPEAKALQLTRVAMSTLSNLVAILDQSMRSDEIDGRTIFVETCEHLVTFIDNLFQSESTGQPLTSQTNTGKTLRNAQILCHRISVLIFNHRAVFSDSGSSTSGRW